MSSFDNKIEAGVLPVPPIYIFPTQMIGMLNLIDLVNFFFKKIINNIIKDKCKYIKQIIYSDNPKFIEGL